jgi:subtilisin family serine protease
MDLDNARRGYPFEGDYPDRDQPPDGRSGQALRRQGEELAQRRYAPDRRHRVIEVLQRRRQGHADLAQLDYLAAEVGFDTLLASGELLVAATDYGQPQVPELIRADMRRVPVDHEGLAGRVVRLVNPDLPATDLAEAARRLRAAGFGASVHHITALAPVGKGLGGPEPVLGLGSLDEYPVSSAGQPARVAIIDTGIAAEIRDDRWLADIPRAANLDPLDSLPDGPNGYLDLQAGHGTFVTGIIEQVAPGADIRMYRAADSDGIGTDLQVAGAMVDAVRDGAQILNLSLGSRTTDDQPPLAIAAALDIIAGMERERGEKVVIVAAAGNYGDTVPCWPAAFPQVVAVAGLTPELTPTEWSSRGPWVTCATIAQGVRSTYVEGREAPDLDPDPDVFPRNAWAAWSGTSFAAPQVSGAVARVCQEIGLAPEQALQQLLASGTPVADFGQTLMVLPGS